MNRRLPSCRARTSPLVAGLLLTTALGAAPASAQERPHLGPDGGPLPFGSHIEIERALAEGDIVEQETLGSGTTGVQRVVIEHDGARLRAVFRHVDQFERNIRLRDGSSFAAFYDRYANECAAYRLSDLLGLDMVPPAVLRYIDGTPGSVQLWVEDAMTEGQRAEEGLRPPDSTAWRRQQAIMRVFDALLANSDRNTGNSLIDEAWNLWLIDHSRSFQIPRGERSYATVNQIPESLWIAIRDLDTEEAERQLSEFIEGPQLRAFLDRRDELIAHIEGLIETRGRGAVIIP